ncbi:MAG: hypothetical protein JW939_09800, partial [Candidatus Thermoplasmatota archaeon]|nr:hypothetical protein [Candidatus Thermoplasmatota archaeon]
HDIGHLMGPTEAEVVEVFKQDHLIVHRVKGDLSLWEPGLVVKGRIDEDRRIQLAQHHTTTHIINGVARSILGNHIWQAGAEKTEEKGRLDITHYETLDKDQLERIEREANRIIDQALEVRSMILPRNEAEEKYGFRLYQGGAVPGEKLRIISIEGLDTEACGGTHLKNTSEAVRITITGTKKIQDGILRLEYVAGRRAKEMYEEDLRELGSIMGLVGIDDPDTLVSRCEDIFELWKRLRKLSSKIRSMDPIRKAEVLEEMSAGMKGNGALESLEHWKKLGTIEKLPEPLSGPAVDVSRPQEYLHQASSVFKVQKQQLWRTTARFFKETDTWLKELWPNRG